MRDEVRMRLGVATAAVLAAVAVLLGGAPAARAAGTGSIAGTVSVTAADGSVAPADHVCVELVRSPYQSTTTDALGHYRFSGVPAGRWPVLASSCGGSRYPDAISWYYGDVGDINAADEVPVADGQAVSGIDVTLPAGGRMSGHVTFDGPPDDGACVYLRTAEGDYTSTPGEGGLDPTTGDFAFRRLLPGGYRVIFVPDCAYDGTRYLAQYYDGASSITDSKVVTVTTTRPATGIDGTFRTGAAVTGRVTDRRGHPLADVCVEASAERGGFADARTGADGRYRATPLADGDYRVSFWECDPDRDGLPTSYVGPGGATTVAVRGGVDATGADAQLDMGTSIAGRVTGPDGAGVPEICADATYRTSTAIGTGQRGITDRDGDYVIHSLVPEIEGGYRVKVYDCVGERTWLDHYYGGDFRSSTARPLSPTLERPIIGADVTLDPGGRIVGIVRGPDGQPIEPPGLCVTAGWMDPDGAGDYFSQDGGSSDGGRYEIKGLPAGAYSLSARDCSWRGQRAVLPTSVRHAVDLRAGGTGRADLRVEAAATISGTAYAGPGTDDPQGYVCAYAVPVDRDSGAVSSDFAESDLTGAYHLLHLTPGAAYQVTFDPCLSGTTLQDQLFDGVGDYGSASSLVATLARPLAGVDAHVTATAPDTILTRAPAPEVPTLATSEPVTFTADVTYSTFECALDGEAWAPCASPYRTGGLRAGEHVLRVRATAHGRTDDTPAEVRWTVDPDATGRAAAGRVGRWGTFRSGGGDATSAADPVHADVTAPARATITAVAHPEGAGADDDPDRIEPTIDLASSGTTATAQEPFRVRAVLDASALPEGLDPARLLLRQDGVDVPDCADPRDASPDPCVAARSELPGDDLAIDLRSSALGAFAFASDPRGTGAPAPGEEAPSVRGQALPGSTLTADPGSWDGLPPLVFSYQWRRDGAPLDGETGASYVVGLADRRHDLGVTVTARSVTGRASRDSARVAVPLVVAEGPLADPDPDPDPDPPTSTTPTTTVPTTTGTTPAVTVPGTTVPGVTVPAVTVPSSGTPAPAAPTTPALPPAITTPPAASTTTPTAATTAVPPPAQTTPATPLTPPTTSGQSAAVGPVLTPLPAVAPTSPPAASLPAGAATGPPVLAVGPAPGQRLADALRRGVLVSLTCSSGCRAAVRLLLPARTARALRLPARTVGRFDGRVTHGQRLVRVRIAGAARRALLRRRSIRLTVRGAGRVGAATSAPVQRDVVLG